MHGEVETSNAPRVISTLIHLAVLVLATWILLSDGASSSSRRLVLTAFGVLFFLRLNLTSFVLLKRRFEWNESYGVLFAIALYQIGFPLLALGAQQDLAALDFFAILLFLLGSYLNTASEWQRLRFKRDPSNAGRLYTGGLFRLSRHVNYFGDTLWVTAWAMLTRNLWAGLIPLALTAAFLFAFIPSLSQHLSAKYGEQYEQWRRDTKAFFPFLY